jgi:hypothetical protein
MADKNQAKNVNEILNNAKNKFEHVIVIGTSGDNLHISSTIATYPFMHWTLNKATLELLLHEKQAVKTQTIEETPVAVEDNKESK